jgi:hypothetical protein
MVDWRESSRHAWARAMLLCSRPCSISSCRCQYSPVLARKLLTSVRRRNSDRACFESSKPQAFITESGTNCGKGERVTCATDFGDRVTLDDANNIAWKSTSEQLRASGPACGRLEYIDQNTPSFSIGRQGCTYRKYWRTNSSRIAPLGTWKHCCRSKIWMSSGERRCISGTSR